MHRVPAVEGRGHPPLQGVRTEVARDDEPRIRALVQSRDPVLEQPVQLILAHPDRRIGSDRPKDDVAGNIVREHGVDIGETEVARVCADEVQSSLVDVDGPHRGVGSIHRKCQGDRPPAAPEVQQMPAGRRGRSVLQQDGCSDVDVIRAENPTGRRDLDGMPRNRDTDAAEIFGTGRRRREVVIALHGDERSGGRAASGRLEFTDA